MFPSNLVPSAFFLRHCNFFNLFVIAFVLDAFKCIVKLIFISHCDNRRLSLFTVTAGFMEMKKKWKNVVWL